MLTLNIPGVNSNIRSWSLVLAVKNVPLKVVVENAGGEKQHAPTHHHAILRVWLPSGDCYAVDLTGAQYGWAEPIMPWLEFFKTRVTRYISARGVEAQAQATEAAWRENYENKNVVRLIFLNVAKRIASAIDETMQTWKKAQGGDKALKNLFRKADESFEASQQEICEAIGQTVEKLTTKMKAEATAHHLKGWPWRGERS